MQLVKAFVILVVVIMMLESCSTVQTKVDPLKKYKMDISIKSGLYEADGMIALPKKAAYSISFESDGRLSLFVFRTCSREIAIENASRGLNPHKVLINYVPNEIESAGACPADVGAFDVNGRKQWAYIDFADDGTTLPGTIVCGSTTMDTAGVSVCQAPIGLIERIKFDTDVIVSPDPGCELDSGNSGKEFTFSMKKDFCIYAFMERAAPNRVHRLTTRGYEEIMMSI